VTQGAPKKLLGCFVAGTMIWGADSSLAIEQIRPGDSVYTFNESHQGIVKRVVSKSYSRNVTQLTVVQFGAAEIFTTSEHPFYVNKAWVEAGRLKVSDLLETENGLKLPVSAIRVIDTAVTVFNISVEEDHDYFVGSRRVLVHNNNPCEQAARDVAKTGSELLKKAKKYGLNANSSTTKQLLDNFEMKAADWIAKFRQRKIKSVEVGRFIRTV
jgi:hypothetical protein